LRHTFDELVACRADEEKRRVLGDLDNVLDEFEEGRLGPVHIFEEDE
jgi:hypothetical protein